MKIALGSDLHLEFGDLPLEVIKRCEADVLVLAGDIIVCKMLKDTVEGHEHVIEFFEACVDQFDHVIYIMGNHEHYTETFQKTAGKIREKLPDGITFLDDEFVEIDGVRFLGSTLWTNCNNDDWFTKDTLRRKMNDYSHIKSRRDNGTYRKLIPEDTMIAHRKSVKFIEDNMTDNCVVVTHHCPTVMSSPPWYRHMINMQGGYVSDLSALMLDNDRPKLWLHGHTHSDCDYMVGNTRVVCNPRGYHGEETRAHDFDFKVIEI